ncbi:uncharacterized protein BJ171DRAFT_539649 [Polychytrium aggregatum]|uniref:uncharacterized protein n=1 Tax=Polychytrium aggregatum TaxID=110093 RepID=UPI0022FE42D2|nr:uncharacterized protein BJ171DRAFT_539649 [Polychytrium aggregatum]KAI9190811.1 hypothetical protein BJ171DRAFT_539649 [Polychytrium aggregatum]
MARVVSMKMDKWMALISLMSLVLLCDGSRLLTALIGLWNTRAAWSSNDDRSLSDADRRRVKLPETTLDIKHPGACLPWTIPRCDPFAPTPSSPHKLRGRWAAGSAVAE